MVSGDHKSGDHKLHRDLSSHAWHSDSSSRPAAEISSKRRTLDSILPTDASELAFENVLNVSSSFNVPSLSDPSPRWPLRSRRPSKVASQIPRSRSVFLYSAGQSSRKSDIILTSRTCSHVTGGDSLSLNKFAAAGGRQQRNFGGTQEYGGSWGGVL